ncbi:MAG: glutamate 5-kinase [Anaerolineaceae bacterium]|jgi:glutamate 5-kinase|nr:glutamate 5-kinase [Anaerolineaceae bacterium]
MTDYHRIVVKIGTSSLTGGSKKLNLPHVTALAQQISTLMDQGRQIALVSSGAIAVGRERLDYPDLPKSIPGKQMLAAVGQPRLMAVYDQLFGIYGRGVAQVLLTREDISDRKRYLNARATLEALLDHGVVPVINENDTVATDEIRIGDNDNLSALVANLIEADLLVLLTDQVGLFSADPNKDPSAGLIEQIDTPEISEAIWKAAGGSRTGLGIGGMLTKLQAAETARRSGTQVVIAKGDLPEVLIRLVKDERIGTLILPAVDKLESRKRFMLAGASSRTFIKVDEGAAKALLAGGSLLPVGVTGTQGNFERGDIVKVKDPEGKDCAIGLSNYSVADLQKIKGRRSSEIEILLGYAYGDEIIHHNNMTILAGKK